MGEAFDALVAALAARGPDLAERLALMLIGGKEPHEINAAELFLREELDDLMIKAALAKAEARVAGWGGTAPR